MRINLNGSILTALTRIFDAIVVTVLFLLCCLPVFTIGAASAAMYATMIALAGDSCTSVVRYYCDAFLSNFKQATMLLFPALLIGAVVAIDIVVCWGFEMESSIILAVMQGLTVFCTCLYTAMSIYIFAGIAVYRVTWKQAMMNALYWCFRKLPATIGLVLLTASMFISVVILWFFSIPVIMLCLYLQGKLLQKIFGLEPEPLYHEEEIEY